MWKSKLPTDPGWYWRRRIGDDSESDIVEVRRYAGDLAIGNSTFTGWDSLTNYEWSGPISHPSNPRVTFLTTMIDCHGVDSENRDDENVYWLQLKELLNLE